MVNNDYDKFRYFSRLYDFISASNLLRTDRSLVSVSDGGSTGDWYCLVSIGFGPSVSIVFPVHLPDFWYGTQCTTTLTLTLINPTITIN